MRTVVSIILLNYNGKQFNKDCIDSILTQNYQNFEIIFVDQCSTDGSLEEVENIYQKEIKSGKIKIIKNPENNGFTGGNNLGVKYADKNSKYICLLNNDTVVQKNWLEKLVQSIEKDNELGAVSCLILDKGGEKKIMNQIYLEHKKQSSSIFGESIYIDMNKTEISSNFYYTSVLGGCCFMYKKHIVKTPFPEYYFAYAEDLYLSRLILNSNHKLGVCLDTFVNHYGSGSFGKKPSVMKLFHGNKNQIINYLVFYPFLYRILLFPLFIIKEVSHLFLGAPFIRLKAKIRGWIWILRNYEKIRYTRIFINKNKKIRDYHFIKQLTFRLSDSFLVDNKILKVLINLGNLLFWIYEKIIIIPFWFTNLIS